LKSLKLILALKVIQQALAVSQQRLALVQLFAFLYSFKQAKLSV
jgi:hypothetical protein